MENNLYLANLIYVTFACVGLMFIVKYGTIFDRPRNWLKSKFKLFDELFSCALCIGFWCGAGIGIYTGYVLLPLYSAAVCWLVDIGLDIAIENLQTRPQKPVAQQEPIHLQSPLDPSREVLPHIPLGVHEVKDPLHSQSSQH